MVSENHTGEYLTPSSAFLSLALYCIHLRFWMSVQAQKNGSVGWSQCCHLLSDNLIRRGSWWCSEACPCWGEGSRKCLCFHRRKGHLAAGTEIKTSSWNNLTLVMSLRWMHMTIPKESTPRTQQASRTLGTIYKLTQEAGSFIQRARHVVTLWPCSTWC